MKRLVSLVCSSIFLFSCSNSNDLNIINSNQIISSQSLEVKHDQKFSEFIKFLQKHIFNAYDKNKDGYLTKTEINDTLMEELDLDKNGKVTKKEAFLGSSYFFNDSNKETIRDLANITFQDIDKNKNKKLDRMEYLEYFVDENTSKEKVIYFKTLFTKNDLDKNDLLVFIEFEDALYQLWKKDIKLNVNEDGTLTIIFPGFKSLVKY
ncbi:MAG: hypothetical protein KatS3mg068_2027 [Candidatus Sericytochromatia bacterium]|nr:MAG: hypothetical protein KatS3mg068_2027 [Candidatus Sericytochromatia bacterium]